MKLTKFIKSVALILSLILFIETIPLEALAIARASNPPQNTLNLLQNTSKTPSNYSKSAPNLLENEPEFDAFVVIVHLRDNKFYAYDYIFYTVGDFMNEDNFTYATTGWKDKLTSFNSKDITYDTAGNPLTYGTWEMEWTAGRQLKRVDSNVATKGSLDFTYNENGLRTSKTLVYTNNGIENTEITKYDWIDGKLMSQSKPYMTLFFFYDGDELVGCSDGTNSYVYEKNLQGDVLGLIDNTGAKVVEYKYSPYGDTLRTYASENSWDLAYANPFRYRSYIQDSDFTGWYYCQSRYYVPQWGRFLNADTANAIALAKDDIVLTNLFAYAGNNPVNVSDASGYFPFHILIGALLGAVIGAIGYILAEWCLNNWDFKRIKFGWNFVIAIVSGAIDGAISASSVSAVWGRVLSAINGFAAVIASGGTVLDAVLSAVIACVLSGAGSGKQFKKFNGNRIASAFKRIKSKGIGSLLKEIKKTIVYYIKSNKTLYRRFGQDLLKSESREWCANVKKDKMLQKIR